MNKCYACNCIWCCRRQDHHGETKVSTKNASNEQISFLKCVSFYWFIVMNDLLFKIFNLKMKESRTLCGFYEMFKIHFMVNWSEITVLISPKAICIHDNYSCESRVCYIIRKSSCINSHDQKGEKVWFVFLFVCRCVCQSVFCTHCPALGSLSPCFRVPQWFSPKDHNPCQTLSSPPALAYSQWLKMLQPAPAAQPRSTVFTSTSRLSLWGWWKEGEE